MYSTRRRQVRVFGGAGLYFEGGIMSERNAVWAHFPPSFREVTSPCGRNKEKHNGAFFHCVDSYDNTPAFFPGKDSGKDEKAPEV